MLTLAVASLLMGVAGGPHCAAMCGAACAGVMRAGGGPAASSQARFQLGRLAGYTLAGAAAGSAVQSLAWLSSHAAVLRPLWMLFHLAVLAWGLMLLVLARQPAWAETASRALWVRMRPVAAARGGLVGTGMLWVFMPCGLLYSALLLASLSGGAVEGALSMALFALGSGVSLGLFPVLLAALRRAGGRLRNDWGTRASGGLLVLAAASALSMDLAHKVAAWCALA